MYIDTKIVGGIIIDPENDVCSRGEILIKGNRIFSITKETNTDAENIIDAQGCIVIPGLIDFHVHLFAGGTEQGINADAALIPMGVTTAVDAGSSGTANYKMFHSAIINTSMMRIKAFLNVSPVGQATIRHHEQLDPQYYDEVGIIELFERYPNELLGLKVRQSKNIIDDLGLKPLKAAIQIAKQIYRPVVVHTTNPPVPMETLVSFLRPGDIFCHVFNGIGETIIGDDGKVKPAMYEARKNGIIFDAANGRVNFSAKVAKEALSEGFFPDIISSDLTTRTLYNKLVFGLPYIMMKYINMGMPVKQVVAACTSTPAKLIGMAGQIGTLSAGALADIAIFRLTEKQAEFQDNLGETIIGDKWLIPQMTIINGKIVFRQIDFNYMN